MMDYKEFYRRNLPHFQPEDGIFFITYHQKLNIPNEIKLKIKEKNLLKNKIEEEIPPDERVKLINKFEKKVFELYDNFLDLGEYGKLIDDLRIPSIIKDNLAFHNNSKYKLYCYCIMPNHIHIILKPFKKQNNKYYLLADIMKSLKGFTAREINIILDEKGQFWHHENYDHYIRDSESFENIVRYILENPVKAGLCADFNDWENNWVCEELKDQFY